MMDASTDAVVIGAGVIGLAVARALALRGREVLILEASDHYGSGTSSRSSEVLHAGLYYPSGSLKAQWCVEGRRRLLDFMRSCGVAHALCGKLVVATSAEEVPALERLHAQALANGVTTVELITGAAARALEPEVRAVAALHSPGTGIVDSHALMTALLGQAQARGAQLVLRTPVQGGQVRDDGSVELRIGGAAPMRLTAQVVVNAAGLTAPAVARAVTGLPTHTIAQASFCKGHYFSLRGRAPFSRLIYPVHNSAGLGTHLTLDLGGQARFGPDVQWLDAVPVESLTHAELDLDYTVDETRAATFERDIRRYWPALPSGALVPAYTGIRPKVTGPGQPAADFILSGPRHHGVRGWIGLYGLESPGLTACLSVADAVLEALGESASPLSG